MRIHEEDLQIICKENNEYSIDTSEYCQTCPVLSMRDGCMTYPTSCLQKFNPSYICLKK